MPSLFIAIGVLIGILLDIACLVFLLVYPYGEPLTSVNKVLVLLICLGLPIFVLIGSVDQGFYSVITINEKGIKRALFGAFLKVEITWE